jgi:DNA-binding NtrC family response regulator
VLIVEDNPVDARYFEQGLNTAFDCLTAHSLSEANIILDDTKADAVLFDMFLPNGAGLNCLEIFARRHSSIPIVAVSGYEFVAEEVVSRGAQEFICKVDASHKKILESVALAITRHRVRHEFAPQSERGRAIMRSMQDHHTRIVQLMAEESAKPKLSDSRANPPRAV